MYLKFPILKKNLRTRRTVLGSTVDPDPHGSAMILLAWIPDPDLGGQKEPSNCESILALALSSFVGGVNIASFYV
jgi:hypothetical protein